MRSKTKMKKFLAWGILAIPLAFVLVVFPYIMWGLKGLLAIWGVIGFVALLSWAIDTIVS